MIAEALSHAPACGGATADQEQTSHRAARQRQAGRFGRRGILQRERVEDRVGVSCGMRQE